MKGIYRPTDKLNALFLKLWNVLYCISLGCLKPKIRIHIPNICIDWAIISIFII